MLIEYQDRQGKLEKIGNEYWFNLKDQIPLRVFSTTGWDITDQDALKKHNIYSVHKLVKFKFIFMYQ